MFQSKGAALLNDLSPYVFNLWESFSQLGARPCFALKQRGGGPGVVVSTAAFHARVQGSFPGLGGLKETKMILPHPLVKLSIAGSLRDREVACTASMLRGQLVHDSPGMPANRSFVRINQSVSPVRQSPTH